LNEQQISGESYKELLGGGRKLWERRGRFQLEFLRARGLAPAHRLLDVGCGPLRAGVHFIGYLDPGNYTGIDCNDSFIRVANKTIKDNGLGGKHSIVTTLNGFNFTTLGQRYDYVMVFSVLNHCDDADQHLFFKNLGPVLNTNSQIYISHARWLRDSHLELAGLCVVERFESDTLDLQNRGWPASYEQHRVAPIYELQLARSQGRRESTAVATSL
jgi:2-polyprenyl-3-methyl-5-hydroxy-6-metoxy-1,4-benzoquinol methylase